MVHASILQVSTTDVTVDLMWVFGLVLILRLANRTGAVKEGHKLCVVRQQPSGEVGAPRLFAVGFHVDQPTWPHHSIGLLHFKTTLATDPDFQTDPGLLSVTWST